MGLDSFTLFGANVVVLVVMAVAFQMAGRGRRNEPYWRSWFAGNLLLALALVFYMSEPRLPDLAVVLVPNGLLVAGFGLRWRAARQFADRRPSSITVALVPSALFCALCLLPPVFGSYGAVYTLANILLAGLAAATALEFWRDRRDGLPSRYGLVFAYGIMAASFAARIGQGILEGSDMARHLPDDPMLVVHLGIALVHTVGSGAFALSIAYERGARDLRRAAMRDPLTGLFNRRAFEQQVREQLEKQPGREFAIVIFDIDNFKSINDLHGHAAGDEAIRKCAAVCSGALREGDIIARVGGEEFAAILTNVTAQQAFDIVEGIRHTVCSTPILAGEAAQSLTLSAGICHSSSGLTDLDQLLQMADRGLYRAKQLGRNRVEQRAA